MALKRSRQASKVSGAPPAMIDSSPVAARSVPPLTGASSMATPLCASVSARRRAANGSIVLMQMTMWPGLAVRTIPCGPAMTASACAVVSTRQIVRSAAAATRSGESATTAPRARSGSTFAGSMSCTISGNPCFTRLSAIGRPMLPSPMKPTARAITSSCSVARGRLGSVPRSPGEDAQLEPLRDPGREHPRRARDPFQELGAAGPVLEHHAAVDEVQDSVDDDRGDDQVVQVAEHGDEVGDQIDRARRGRGPRPPARSSSPWAAPGPRRGREWSG